ncbi:hypothetical protein J6590_053763 [Homalodisca vitripennis]|nr:hypothetical protein J6590_053763 [Homalodisca vitripennis]
MHRYPSESALHVVMLPTEVHTSIVEVGHQCKVEVILLLQYTRSPVKYSLEVGMSENLKVPVPGQVRETAHEAAVTTKSSAIYTDIFEWYACQTNNLSSDKNDACHSIDCGEGGKRSKSVENTLD